MSEERTFVTKKMSTGRIVRFEFGIVGDSKVAAKETNKREVLVVDGSIAIKITGKDFDIKNSPEYKEALREALSLIETAKKSGLFTKRVV